LKKLLGPFEQANLSGAGPRMEPLTVMFEGSSGVGKSAAVMPIISSCLSKILEEDLKVEFKKNFMSFIYNRQPEHKYWDGYHGQFVTVWDEFGAMRDSVGNYDSNEFMEILRTSNLFPNICHMAHLETKGNTVFKSKMLFCTTNMTNLQHNIHSLVCNEAVIRRFDFNIQTTIKEEYQNGTSTLPQSLNLNHPDIRNNAFNKDVYKFIVHKNPSKHKDEFIGEFDWDGLVDLLVKRFDEKEGRSVQYLQKVKDIVDGNDDVDEDEAIKQMEAFVSESGGDEFEALMNDVEDNILDMSIEEFLGIDSTSLYDENVFKSYLEIIDHMKVLEVPNWRLLKFCNDVKGHELLKDLDVSLLRLLDFMFKKLGTKLFFILQIKEKILWQRTIDNIAIRFSAEMKGMDCAVVPLGSHICEQLNVAKNIFIKSFLLVKDWLSKYVASFCSGSLLTWSRMLTISAGLVGSGLLLNELFNSHNVVDKDATVNKLWPDGADKCVLFSTVEKGKENEPYFRLNDEFWNRYIDLTPNGKHKAVMYGLKGSVCLADPSGKNPWATFMVTQDDGVSEQIIEDTNDGSRFLEPQSNPNMKLKGKYVKKNGHKNKYGREHKGAFMAETGYDENMMEIAYTVANKNLYTIRLSCKQEVMGHILFVKGTTAIFPNHFLALVTWGLKNDGLLEDDVVIFMNKLTDITFECTVRQFLDCSRCTCSSKLQDIAAIEFKDKTVKQHRDIVSYFLTDEQASNMTRFDVIMALPEPNTNKRILYFLGSKAYKHYGDVIKPRDGGSSYVLDSYMRYSVQSRKGFCGAPVFYNESASANKLAAIHVAGDSAGNGIGTIITQTMLNTFFNSDTQFEPQGGHLPFQGDFTYIGEMMFPVGEVHTSQIRKSKLYQKWGPALTKPAHLKPVIKDGIIFDPKNKAVSKYGKLPIFIDPNKIELITDAIYSEFINSRIMLEFGKPKVYNIIDAIKGIPGQMFFDSIPRGTSPGYPYIVDKPSNTKGKSYYIGVDEFLDVDSTGFQILARDVNHIVAKAKIGERIDHYFVDVLKDERRPINKVNEMKTRLISTAPLAYVVAVRMYFIDFCRFLMLGRIDNECAVGVNPYSNDWNYVARRLLGVGDKVVAGDFSGFDTAQEVVVLIAILKIINRWYDGSKEEELVRSILFMEVYNSKHICRTTIYEWHKCLPSGHPLTTIINCLYNKFLWRLCWMFLVPIEYRNLDDFTRHVALIVYGDDNAAGISDDVIDFFNQCTLTMAMQTVGMIYTNEDKTEVNDTFRDISNVSFLKRQFYFDKETGIYTAPLSLSVVLEIPYWTRKGVHCEQIERDNVQTSLQELSLHPQAQWDIWAPKILQASRDFLMYVPTTQNRSAIKQAVLDREYHY
jgi:hypothetical protein